MGERASRGPSESESAGVAEQPHLFEDLAHQETRRKRRRAALEPELLESSIEKVRQMVRSWPVAGGGAITPRIVHELEPDISDAHAFWALRILWLEGLVELESSLDTYLPAAQRPGDAPLG